MNALNAYQNTPLHAACIEGLTDCSEALLKAGADIQQPSGDMSNNATPLHLAAEYSHNRLVEMLLKKGADAKALDSNGKTPLELAMETVVSIGELHQQRTVETLCNFLGEDVPSEMVTAERVSLDEETAREGPGGSSTTGVEPAGSSSGEGDNPRPSEDITGVHAANLALDVQALALKQRAANEEGASSNRDEPPPQSGCKCLIS